MTGSQRKKTWLAVLGVGVLLLLASDVGFLLWSLRRYKEALNRLEQQKQELAALYEMAPFPSPQNVEREEKNLTLLTNALSRIQERLAARQIEPNPDLKQPTVFMDSFWQTRRDLLNKARTAGIELPKDFAFGFERYLQGTPPKPEHVPRLMQQLTIARRLCDVLLQSKVTAIDAVGREVFESEEQEESSRSPFSVAPSPRTGRRPRIIEEESSSANRFNPDTGLLSPGELFTRMRFALWFRAREEVVVQVLNALAAHEIFLAIDRLQWNAPLDQVTIRKRVIPGDREEEKGILPAALESKESRIVSGREAVLTIRLDVEAYRFARRVD